MPPSVFAPTRWSLVCATQDTDESIAQGALQTLCSTYWYPLYAYVRRKGYSVEEAEDLTQEFFARFLATDFLARATPEKGRFRTFLLTALQRFLANEWHRATAHKRGGGKTPVPIDLQNAEDRYRNEPVDSRTPELLYERQWALALLAQVLAQLEAEYTANGQRDLFHALKPLLGGQSTGEPGYAEIAERLGVTEASIKVGMYRLRRRYADRLRAEIAHTVISPDEVEDEIRRLFDLFSE